MMRSDAGTSLNAERGITPHQSSRSPDGVLILGDAFMLPVTADVFAVDPADLSSCSTRHIPLGECLT